MALPTLICDNNIMWRSNQVATKISFQSFVLSGSITKKIVYARDCATGEELRKRITESQLIVNENRLGFRLLRGHFLKKRRL